MYVYTLVVALLPFMYMYQADCWFVSSSGFYFLFKDINKNIRTFENIWDTVMQLFQMTLGEFRVSVGSLLLGSYVYHQSRDAVLTPQCAFACVCLCLVH